jgi:hypothetical protein
MKTEIFKAEIRKAKSVFSFHNSLSKGLRELWHDRAADYRKNFLTFTLWILPRRQPRLLMMWLALSDRP